METQYDFGKQLNIGSKEERVLDRHFSKWYTIRPASRNEQREGIDRHFDAKGNGRNLTVEYKADFTASKTGNAFVETISVDTQNKPGWVYRSKANYLIYYLPQDMLIYCIEFSKLRKKLNRWEQSYSKRAIPNKGYNTHGILVPLHEFEEIAETVISL